MANKWTEEEIKLLKREYPEKGVDIPELLKNHSKDAIYNRARELLVRRAKWTEKEIELLKKEYPEKGMIIPELLKKYSKRAIRHKAINLRLKTNSFYWTKEDEKLLKQKYPELGSDIPELLEKYSANSIMVKAKNMGVKCGLHIWTAKELEILEKEYCKKGADIPELLERHSRKSIIGKVTKMKIARVVDFNGHKHRSVGEMCEYYGIDYRRYNGRRRRGWSQKYALTVPRMATGGRYFVYKYSLATYIACSEGTPYFKCDCCICHRSFIGTLEQVKEHSDKCEKERNNG